jgi:pyroglutamyl-peptidase
MASRSRHLSPTILVTGFGPFPGAPFNPTIPLVERLARLRRPALADIKIVPHIFPTSYAAVDRELPRLIAEHRPRALLMFGLASRTKTLRIETRARNALARLRDVTGQTPAGHCIRPGGASSLPLSAHAPAFLTAVRSAHAPVVMSRDAGRYLCNYLCWRAAEASQKDGGPRLTTFIHVPAISRAVRPKTKRHRPTLDDLTRTAGRILLLLAAAARR